MLVVLVVSSALAADVALDPASDIIALTSALSPGSTVTFADGTYTISGTLDWTGAGTEDAPIHIRAADGAHPVIQLAENGGPIVRIHECSWITVEGLTFEGTDARIEAGGFDGLNVSDCSNLTIKDTVWRKIRSTGVYFRGTNTAVTFVHNEITDVREGTALAMGCWDASCTTVSSAFENNWIHNWQGEYSSGIWVGPGSADVLIKDNVLHTALFRGIQLESTEYGERNQILANAIWSVGDTGIQVSGSSIVSNNLVFNVDGRGIRADGGDRVFEKVSISNNTVASTTGWGIEVYDFAGKEGMVLANNAITNPTGYGLRTGEGHLDANNYLSTNVVSGLVEGFAEYPSAVLPGSGVADYEDLTGMDFYPGDDSALVDVGDPSGDAWLPEVDFNGSLRDGEEPDVGAYELIAGANPGWAIQEGFKDTRAAEAPPQNVGGCNCGGGKDTDEAALALLLPLAVFAGRRRRR